MRPTVSDPRIPILSSFGPISKPGVSRSTMNALIPFGPPSGVVLAKAALVLLLQALSMVVLVTPAALALTLAWLVITVVIVKRFRRLVSREQELLARTDLG